MSVKAAADRSYEDLKQALAEGRLPTNVADTAVKLLDRLHQPVKVSVMGLPGSGKSSILNLLMSKSVIPEGVSLPTTQFLKGDVEQAVCTLPDGSTQIVEGIDPHAVAALNPIFVEFHMDLPALRRISLLEVVAPDVPKEQQRAMHWAAKRTDIALMCTQTFTTLEQALWQSLPEQVKDHAIMLVTRADLLEQDGRLDRMISEIRYANAHQFNKIMPVATTDAIAARRADGSVDKPLLQQSGGLTLISTILRQVDRGLQATVDQSDLILHKYRDAPSNPDAVRIIDKVEAPRPISRPLPQTPAPVTVDEHTPVVLVETSEPVATGTSKAIPTSDATKPDLTSTDAFIMRSRALSAVEAETPKARPLSELVKPVRSAAVKPVAEVDFEAPRKPRPGFMPKAKAAEVLRAKPETCAAYGEAIAYLTQQGRALTEKLSSEGELSSDELMNASADNITWLTDYLDEVNVTDDPVLEKTRNRALDASELVQLMQFEKNEDAGIEALSLVIQLKRDLEAEVAQSTHASQIKAA